MKSKEACWNREAPLVFEKEVGVPTLSVPRAGSGIYWPLQIGRSGSDHGKFHEAFWFREIQARKGALAAIFEANSGTQFVFVSVLMRVQ